MKNQYRNTDCFCRKIALYHWFLIRSHFSSMTKKKSFVKLRTHISPISRRHTNNGRTPRRKVNLMLIKPGATIPDPYGFKRIEAKPIAYQSLTQNGAHSSMKDCAAGPIKIDTTIYNQSIFISGPTSFGFQFHRALTGYCDQYLYSRRRRFCGLLWLVVSSTSSRKLWHGESSTLEIVTENR